MKSKLALNIRKGITKSKLPPCILAVLMNVWSLFLLIVASSLKFLGSQIVLWVTLIIFSGIILLGGILLLLLFNRIFVLNLSAISSFLYSFCLLQMNYNDYTQMNYLDLSEIRPGNMLLLLVFVIYIFLAIDFSAKKHEEKDSIFDAKMEYIENMKLLLRKNLLYEDEGAQLKTAILNETFMFSITDSLIGKLEKLKKLHDIGTLTDKEYRSEKSKVLEFPLSDPKSAKIEYMNRLKFLFREKLISADEAKQIKAAIYNEGFVLHTDYKIIQKLGNLKNSHNEGELSDLDYRLEKAKILKFNVSAPEPKEETAI